MKSLKQVINESRASGLEWYDRIPSIERELFWMDWLKANGKSYRGKRAIDASEKDIKDMRAYALANINTIDKSVKSALENK